MQKLSAIEMRPDRALPSRPVAKSDGRELSPQQEVEDNGMDWVEDKRLYLPFTGQVGDSLYSNTWEAVHTLKCPLMGIDRSHNDSEIDQSIMMDTYYIKG
jgi:hypothetical protein